MVPVIYKVGEDASHGSHRVFAYTGERRKISDIDCCAMQDIWAVAGRFEQYSVLWNQERDTELETFLDSDPHLRDFEEKFRFYDELEKQISSEPDCSVVGPIAVHTGNVYAILCALCVL